MELVGRGRWWGEGGHGEGSGGEGGGGKGGGGDGVDIACAWRTIIITSIFAVQILSYLSLYCVLIICCQVIPSKEITRALDIAILHPPSHKTVKDTPSTVCSLLSNLVHSKGPPLPASTCTACRPPPCLCGTPSNRPCSCLELLLLVTNNSWLGSG